MASLNGEVTPKFPAERSANDDRLTLSDVEIVDGIWLRIHNASFSGSTPTA